MPSSRKRPGADTSAPPASVRIVPAKLRPPRVREELLPRPTLLDRLRSGRESSLTLVCAPAGYGKTTLLAQWEQADSECAGFVWIALDEGDSDPVRLWSHVVAGLHEAYDAAGAESSGALLAGPGAISSTVLPALVAELEHSPPIALVLDDWHLLASPACDATLSSFVEWAPGSVQIVVSSRSDPGLPLALLRAHGELTEIRAADLRLSQEETSAFFDASGIALGPDDVERMTERTEGWLAGLWLALLAARERGDPADFLSRFSGETRHVTDYLALEVLQSLPDERQDFLLRTSVLDPLTGALCDAVLDTTGSASMLAGLERANLFVTELDEPGSYRYHHLFAAVLRSELESRHPGLVLELHGRAADWLETSGDVERAIDHAIGSRNVLRASDLLVAHAQSYWTSGRVLTVARWLDALSWPAAQADPQLALVRANVAGATGGTRGDIERWLAVAESAPDTGPLVNGLASLHTAVALIRAGYVTQGVSVTARETRRALAAHPEPSQWRANLLTMLGQALYLDGHSREALPLLREARTIPDPAGRALAAAQTLAYLSFATLESGDVAEAEHLAQDALELLERQHLGASVVAANPHVALGRVLEAAGALEPAVHQFELAVELAAPATPSYWHAHALVRLAAARHGLGDDAGATEALELAHHCLGALPDTGMLSHLYRRTADAVASVERGDGALGEPLSAAELRIVEKLVEGLSIQQVARSLWLSPNTVRTHRLHIYRKLGVHTREELVEAAEKAGLFTPGERP